MLHPIKPLIPFLLLIFSISSFAATPAVDPSIFDQLSKKDVLEVSIEMDLEGVMSNFRNNDKHAANFSYTDEFGQVHDWNIQVKLRGKFRRMKCTETPPLKIYFDKTALANKGFAKYNDLKIINYCLEDKAAAKELILKEYLAYKMYNELTEMSFRVQLAKITYKDTKSSRTIEQWAFLMEDLAQVRARILAHKYNMDNGAENEKFDAEQLQMASLFQYLIGNSDWNLERAKNVKILKKEGQLIAIPYDFDFSGWVNPSYGRLNSNLEVSSLRERVYLGYPETVQNIQPTIDLFKAKRVILVKLIENFSFAKRTSKRQLLRYLDSFYKNLNPESIEKSMRLNKKLISI